MSRRSTWQAIYQRFDPELESVPSAWHDLSAWRVQRERSPAKEICLALDRPKSQLHGLLSGTMGTGKTTELLRIAEERSRKGDEFVVFLDLVQHFRNVVGDLGALQHVTSWEVCFLVGVALIRAAGERLSYRFSEALLKELEAAWIAAAKATQMNSSGTELDVAALAKSLIIFTSTLVPGGAAMAAGLTLLESGVGAMKWQLPMGRREARPLADQDSAAQTLLASVNQMIGTFQQWNRRVLFVIDGLDRIRDFNHAQSLFLESEMIGRLGCPLVIASPFALRYHMATMTIRSFNKICTLVNEPVLLQDDPDKHGPGVDFLCDVYRKRVIGLDAQNLIPQALLERLAFYSGGRTRDFVKSIGLLGEYAYDEDAAMATASLVDKVIEESRQLIETGLHQGHIELLAKVAADPKHRLPSDPHVEDLLNYGRLLSYPNESEWYYPHPLLTLHLVKPARAGLNG